MTRAEMAAGLAAVWSADARSIESQARGLDALAVARATAVQRLRADGQHVSAASVAVAAEMAARVAVRWSALARRYARAARKATIIAARGMQ